MKNRGWLWLVPIAIGSLLLGASCSNLANEPAIDGLTSIGSPITITSKVTRIPAISRGNRQISIPENAVEKAPGVFYLGEAIHEGQLVEGYAIIDYKEGHGHKSNHGSKGGPPDKPGKTSTCYAFLANGASWKTVEGWVLDPINNALLDAQYLLDNISADISKWEVAGGTNIFGTGVIGAVNGADMISPDGINEVLFGNISNAGAIAVTIVWGIFSGPPRNRSLVEWDQVYDDIDFDWSNTGSPSSMDFENIASHEIGHAIGMGHPADECTEDTMYRFATFGETKKKNPRTRRQSRRRKTLLKFRQSEASHQFSPTRPYLSVHIFPSWPSSERADYRERRRSRSA